MPGCAGARAFHGAGLLSHLVGAGERLPGSRGRSAGRPGSAPRRRGDGTRSPVRNARIPVRGAAAAGRSRRRARSRPPGDRAGGGTRKPFSRVEAAVFLGAAELAAGDVARGHERARNRAGARAHEAHRPVVRAAHPGDARGRKAHRRRSPRGARLLDEARASVERGRGWRLGACDVELARVRLLASEPVPDPSAVASASRPRTPSPPNWAPDTTSGWRRSSAPASLERCRVASPQSSRGGTACQPSG